MEIAIITRNRFVATVPWRTMTRSVPRRRLGQCRQACIMEVDGTEVTITA